MPRLSGRDLLALRAALLDALPTPDDWEEVLLAATDTTLDNMTRPARLPARALEALQWTEARNVTDDLIAAALDLAPNNDELKALVKQRSLNTALRFESIVHERFKFEDVADWRGAMVRSECAVCRVEESLSENEHDPLGTGFLVGDDLVMTNYHVVETYILEHLGADHLGFRFDYKLEAGQIDDCPLYALAPEWLVASSPADALDYALMRLDQPAGTQPAAPGAPARGYLRPTNAALAERDPLMIIQHPKAVPLKFALGTVTGFGSEPGKARVKYDVNTQDGSSGSPCFFSDWSLVALHSAGGAKDNEGVPFRAINDDLAKKKVALGA